MTTSKTAVPQNMRAGPMVHRVERAPNLTLQRILLAQNAEGMTVEQLRTEAEAAQIDLSGATTKESMIAAVQSQVRGAEPQPEG